MSSQDHLQSLAKQSISRRSDVEAIERQIIELQGQLNLARAESQTKDNELDEAIMLLASAQAREIVQVMFDILPAELCTHIFSYLVPQNTIIAASKVFTQDFPYSWDVPAMSASPEVLNPICWPAPNSGLAFHAENTHPPAYIPPKGRIFQSTYISETVALEAAKTFYRGNTFIVDVRVPQSWLRQLLEFDHFQFGLEPFNLIRRLCLEIPAECCHWPPAGIRRARAAPVVGREELDRLIQYNIDLSTNLALIPSERRKMMELTFIIKVSARKMDPMEHWEVERYFLNMLMCVRGVIHDTKKHCSKVKVYARLRGSVPVDISELAPLSIEEWDNEPEHPQLDTVYIPPASVTLPADQSIESLRDQAREYWGYESFETLLVRPGLENLDFDGFYTCSQDLLGFPCGPNRSYNRDHIASLDGARSSS